MEIWICGILVLIVIILLTISINNVYQVERCASSLRDEFKRFIEKRISEETVFTEQVWRGDDPNLGAGPCLGEWENRTITLTQMAQRAMANANKLHDRIECLESELGKKYVQKSKEEINKPAHYVKIKK